MKTVFMIVAFASMAAAEDRAASLPVPASGNVTLTLDEYNRLIELGRKPVKKVDVIPVSFAIKSVVMKFEVRGESVSGDVQVEGEVFRKGQVRVPLLSGVTVFDAHQQSRELPLQQEGNTQMAILSGPADFSASLRAGLPLNMEAGRASLQVPVPAAGSVRLSLVIPGDHTNVQLSSGIITNRTSSGGRTTIEATLIAGQPATLWWATREVAAPPVPREVRFLSEVKTLISVSEALVNMSALLDITVVQGYPVQFEVAIPSGYEVTGVIGPSLDSSEVRDGVAVLKLNSSTSRSHQFLILMEKPLNDVTKAAFTFVNVKGAQRETGEVLVEGAGALELAAKESGGAKRMDLREMDASLRSLGRNSLHSAFRYHKQAAETPSLALEWVRFPDSKLLAAVAERGVVTTLVTSEGRTLTEVRLTIKNHSQPFMKVTLPAGATILSADVAGERVKPAQGADGNRIPLLRPGFRPSSSYPVSFVFMHSGAPFAKKGGSELALPPMDLPIGVLEWEVFLPEQFKVRDFGGNALSRALLPDMISEETDVTTARSNLRALTQGELGGVVVDSSGARVPGANITVTHPLGVAKAVADVEGRWLVPNIGSGRISVMVEHAGFARFTRVIDYDGSQPLQYTLPLQVGALAETIEVTAQTPTFETSSSSLGRARSKDSERQAAQNSASANVVNLQRRVAGVLPIKIDVPRTGASYRFVRPLVVGDETKLTFNYRNR